MLSLSCLKMRFLQSRAVVFECFFYFWTVSLDGGRILDTGTFRYWNRVLRAVRYHTPHSQRTSTGIFYPNKFFAVISTFYLLNIEKVINRR
jgi:hypothetical protein